MGTDQWPTLKILHKTWLHASQREVGSNIMGRKLQIFNGHYPLAILLYILQVFFQFFSPNLYDNHRDFQYFIKQSDTQS